MDKTALLKAWEHEMQTNEQGMAHMAINRVLVLRHQISNEQAAAKAKIAP